METNKVYKTYQECKIANPMSDVYTIKDYRLYCVSKSELYSAYWKEINLPISTSYSAVAVKCRPSLECVSLQDFFDAGHKPEEVEKYTDSRGDVVYTDYTDRGDNIHPNNEELYLLKAVALDETKLELRETSAHLTLEDGFDKIIANKPSDLPDIGVEVNLTFNGETELVTPLYYTKDSEGEVAMFYRCNDKQLDDEVYDWCWVHNCVLSKPETPEEKQKREETQAAYCLYKKCHNNAKEVRSLEEFVYMTDLVDLWVGIVRETGYKGEG